MSVPDGKETTGSQANDAGDPSLARGAAGRETGARPSHVATHGKDRPGDDLEARRETQQVLRPATDGVGEGLPKDQG